jgi:hypothetical protein
VALRRKNLLFAGFGDGAKCAAAIDSLIGPVTFNDLGCEAHLRYVLERIAACPINKIDDRLP